MAGDLGPAKRREAREEGRGLGGRFAVESARQRLLLWNISPLDIEALGQSGEPRRSLKLYSPISGFIVGKTAVHGMRVKPEDALFDIVDVSHLWVLAEVPEQDLPRLRLGQSATVTLPYWPGRSWRSRVSYLYPALDPRMQGRPVKAVRLLGQDLVLFRAQSGEPRVLDAYCPHLGAHLALGGRDWRFESPDPRRRRHADSGDGLLQFGEVTGFSGITIEGDFFGYDLNAIALCDLLVLIQLVFDVMVIAE